ncbi:DUF3396 domain-containing protein [Mesorhizobium sp. B3-1-3]|uniref:type VI immunity family protein n=1 Tax=unclassified Mesorhizobium TaxID=325217 RepID=UPI00112683B0|nr:MULTISPECIES: type VI immunity family protein [unclassified Mesorhizobium]TPI65662.1 DUF3396 domain-containing protein [Mesorhizobium sp. B3-1-8]TPI71749.1 DUF3396 domain-containing protein [Mesorhizobium sp. B3-1-3]
MLNDVMKNLSSSENNADYVRVNLVFSLFCKGNSEDLIDPGLWLLEKWNDYASKALGWALVGKNASTIAKVNKSTMERLQREIRSTAEVGLTGFRYQGPQPYAPDYRMRWLVNREAADPTNAKTNLIELMVPVPGDAQGWQSMAQTFREISEHFPYDTGYASPGLVFGDDAAKVEAGAIIGPLAMRHKGFDVPNNATTSYFVGKSSRGARWLTLLSREKAAEIGLSTIGNLPQGAIVAPTKNGWMIVASDIPEVGDTNRGVEATNLQWLARILEPISFFGDRNLKMLLSDRLDFVDRWERRFLSAAGQTGPL